MAWNRLPGRLGGQILIWEFLIIVIVEWAPKPLIIKVPILTSLVIAAILP